jgi:hypothetical protein
MFQKKLSPPSSVKNEQEVVGELREMNSLCPCAGLLFGLFDFEDRSELFLRNWFYNLEDRTVHSDGRKNLTPKICSLKSRGEHLK